MMAQPNKTTRDVPLPPGQSYQLPDWVCVELIPHASVAPGNEYRLTLLLRRQWLLDKSRSELCTLLSNQDTAAFPLDVEFDFKATDLILDSTDSQHSTLGLLQQNFPLSPIHCGSMLQARCLVRVEAADALKIYGRVLSGLIRFDKLNSKPNILEYSRDRILRIWPEQEALSSIILGHDRFQLEILSNDSDKASEEDGVYRLDYLRALTDGRILWREVHCPEDNRVRSPKQDLVELINRLQEIISESCLQLYDIASNTERASYRLTSLTQNSVLLNSTSRNKKEIVASNALKKNTRIILAPGERHEESVLVTASASASNGPGYTWELDNFLRFDHKEGTVIRYAPQGTVQRIFRPGISLALQNEDGSRSRWVPFTLLEQSTETGRAWHFLDLDVVLALENGNCDVETQVINPDSRISLLSSSKKNTAKNLKEVEAKVEVSQLPALHLIGCEGMDNVPGYIWQLASLKIKGSERESPPVWVRHQIGEFAASDNRDDYNEGFTLLSNPIRLDWKVKENNWSLQLDLPDIERTASIPSLELIIQLQKKGQEERLRRIEIKLRQSRVRVLSGLVPIATVPDIEPSSSLSQSAPQVASAMPGITIFDEQTITFAKLAFENLPTSGDHLSRLSICQINPSKKEQNLLFTASGEALTAYLPGPRAVIDPASSARVNLVTGVDSATGRLLRDRDPSHGLLAAPVSGGLYMETVLQNDKQNNPNALSFMRIILETAIVNNHAVNGKRILGALSLNPWMEIEEHETGQLYVRSLHANAALEQADYDIAGNYLRPAKPENTVPPRLAAETFRSSVRDQFIPASDFVPLPQDNKEGEPVPLINWLPCARRIDSHGAQIDGPKLSFADGEYPAVILHAGVGVNSRLDILEASKPGFRWLRYGITWHNRNETPPQLLMTEEPQHGDFSARNATAELVFDSGTANCIAASGDWVAVGEVNRIHLRRRSEAPLEVILTIESEVHQLTMALFVPSPESPERSLLIAAADRDGIIHLWNLLENSLTPVKPDWSTDASYLGNVPKMGGHQITFLPDLTRLAVGTQDGRLFLFNVLDGQYVELEDADDTKQAVIAVQSVKSGSLVIIVALQQNGLISAWGWDPDKEKPVFTHELGTSEPFLDAAFVRIVERNRLYAVTSTQLLGYTIGPDGIEPERLEIISESDESTVPITGISAATALRPKNAGRPTVNTLISLRRTDGTLRFLVQDTDSDQASLCQTKTCLQWKGVGAATLVADSRLALAWISGPRGEISGWDPVRQRLFDRWQVPPRSLLDNAGFSLDLHSRRISGECIVQPIQFPPSSSTTYIPGFLVSGQLEFKGGDSPNRTEVYFRCNGLPVYNDGRLFGGAKGQLPAPCGIWSEYFKEGFASHWARICGIPVWMTGIEQCLFNDKGQPSGLVFRAVIPCPTDGNSIGSQDVMPISVSTAINKKAFIRVRLEKVTKEDASDDSATELSVEILDGSKVNWRLPRQSKRDGVSFPADLVGLQGTVHKSVDMSYIEIRPEKAEIAAFERSWILLEQLPNLSGFGSEDGFCFQSALLPAIRMDFKKPVDSICSIIYHVCSNSSSVTAQLPLPLDAGKNAPEISAWLVPFDSNEQHSPQISLSVKIDGIKTKAYPSFFDNSIYSFILNPPAGDNQSGEQLLLLWPEGELTSPKIGGMFLENKVAVIPWKVAGIDSSDTVTTGLRLTYSTFNNRRELDWKTDEFTALTITGISDEFTATLLVAEQLLSAEEQFDITGILRLDKEDDGIELQLPVKLRLAVISGQKILNIQSGVYAVQKMDISTNETAAQIFFPGTEAHFTVDPIFDSNVSVDEQEDENNQRNGIEFVHLSIDQGQIRLRTVPPEAIPFSPCLDRQSWHRIPQLREGLPRLLHRNSYGSQLRPDLTPVAMFEIETSGNLPDWLSSGPKSGNYMLSPVVKVKEFNGIGILFETFWLQKKNQGESSPFQTENIFSLRRSSPEGNQIENSRHRSPSLNALLNITEDITADSTEKQDEAKLLLDSERLRSLLEQTGTSGFLAHRIVSNDGVIRLRPVRVTGHSNIEAPYAVNSIPYQEREALLLTGEHQEDMPAIDAKILSPYNARRLKLKTPHGYCLTPDNNEQAIHSNKIKTDNEYEETDWGRRLSLELGAEGEFHLHDKPLLRMLEQTIWQRPAALPLEESLPISISKPAADDGFTGYLPKNLVVYYGSDKRGGMISHSIHPYCTKEKNDNEQIGSSINAVMREPLRFTPSYGSAIKLNEVNISASQLISLPECIQDVSLSWEEIIETRELSSLDLATKLSIICNGDDSLNCRLKTDGDKPTLALVSLVNERIVFGTRDSFDLPLSTVSAKDLLPPIFLITSIKNISSEVTVPSEIEDISEKKKFKLIIEALTDKDRYFNSFETVFNLKESIIIPGTGQEYYLWELKPTTSGTENSIRWNQLSYLNFFWEDVDDNENEIHVDIFQVRQIPPSPLTARLTVVLREDNDPSQFERTILFGEAAPLSQANLRFGSDPNASQLEYVNFDEEKVSVSLPNYLTGNISRIKIYIVKTNGDGTVLSTSKLVSVN